MKDLNKKEILQLKGNHKYIGTIVKKNKKILIYECELHGKIEQRFDVHIKHNFKCPKCPNIIDRRIYTIEYIKSCIEKRIIKYDFIFESEIYGSRDKIKLICNTHGIFTQTIHNHFTIGNNCPECNKNKDISELTLNKLKNKGINVIKYNGFGKYSNLNCIEHGEFNSTISNTLQYGCPICNKNSEYESNRLKFIEKSKKQWDILIGFNYDTLIYNGMSKKVKIYSERTGWIEQNADNHVRGFLPKNSTGELIIKSILKDKKILFEEQKKFDGCKNTYKLRFDFYLPEKNMCIEFNGIQHYKPIEFFGGENRLNEQQKNDKIKVNFCETNNIKLLIISYKDRLLERINEIIEC